VVASNNINNIETNNNFFTPGLLSSLFLHLLFFLLLLWFQNFHFGQPSSIKDHLKISSPLEIVPLENIDIPKYKQVGTSDGKKEFSLPVAPKPHPIDAKRSKGKSIPDMAVGKSGGMRDSDIKLSDLESKNLSDGISIQHSKTIKEMARPGEIESLGIPSKLSATTREQYVSSPIEDAVLSNSAFNFKFSPPEGVPLDQLNSTEKIFYSFQKRTFEAYVASFMKAFNQLSLQYPHLKQRLDTDRHKLTGKIIFDSQGNIVTIKIIQWSRDDLVQKLFDETLAGIRSLRNPPKAFISREGEFYIYFQLHIN